MIRVVICDDHEMVREALSSVLNLEDDISVVGMSDSLVTTRSAIDAAGAAQRRHQQRRHHRSRRDGAGRSLCVRVRLLGKRNRRHHRGCRAGRPGQQCRRLVGCGPAGQVSHGAAGGAVCAAEHWHHHRAGHHQD